MICRVKICIVSDSHDRADALERAVNDAAAEGAQAVIHCGDLIGAHTRASGGLLHYHGPDARLDLGGRKIFLVHYPEYGYAMACTGNWDLVCCGHSHQAGVERVATVKGGGTWLVNPGTIAGLSAPATWVLGDLDAMRYEVFKLSMAA
jgi:uncharacterized protein